MYNTFYASEVMIVKSRNSRFGPNNDINDNKIEKRITIKVPKNYESYLDTLDAFVSKL